MADERRTAQEHVAQRQLREPVRRLPVAGERRAGSRALAQGAALAQLRRALLAPCAPSSASDGAAQGAGEGGLGWQPAQARQLTELCRRPARNERQERGGQHGRSHMDSAAPVTATSSPSMLAPLPLAALCSLVHAQA